MRKLLRILSLAPVLIVLACSRPAAQSQQDVDAMRKQIEALKASQEQMQKDLEEIKTFLKAATGGRYGAPSLSKAVMDISKAPANGQAGAPLTIVEISDYHCPFCRRHYQQTNPQLYTDYVSTGKVRHVFIHFPVDQLHPDAFKSHEAAMCAADQDKFWALHTKLFETQARTEDELTTLAQAAGLDVTAFRACFESKQHAAEVKASVDRMSQLGVTGTPMFLIGKTPAGNEPFTPFKVLEGAQPYTAFKQSIDAAIAGKQ